jgi:hypothetical protein
MRVPIGQEKVVAVLAAIAKVEFGRYPNVMKMIQYASQRDLRFQRKAERAAAADQRYDRTLYSVPRWTTCSTLFEA